ncbi:MAG TPA: alpha-L-fucosidase [Bryobacteraceae bacterium]|nr:alpha-L-fucosidase [Bryobacteraceae bacterium]
MTRRSLLALGAAALARGATDAPYRPATENLRAREWFQNAKFGLFIHWGVYSVLGHGEWVMNNEKIPISEYERIPARFNPVNYDPAAWVSLAKQAGMKYITITSKHHDGFAMFATKQSKWNIVDATPYGKDVLKPLADECRRQGVRLFFYHSHLDWHHPDYYPLGQTGHYSGRPPGGDFNRYLDYMDAQLTELLTGYGEVAGIWFDGIWDRRDADWKLRRTYDMIHRLQPAAMVGNNHHLPPFEGEDFQMFEKDLPGGNTAGFNGESKIGTLPLETCDTINGAWGYDSRDKNYKSTKQLIHYVVRAAGNNGNFLLNVGPKPDGTIQDEFQTRLREMGAWLGKNGESIYGTRGGPITPRPWGVTTRKGNRTYVHVLDWEDELLAMPKIPFKKASLLGDGSPVTVRAVDGGMLLHLPKAGRDPLDTVVVLES